MATLLPASVAADRTAPLENGPRLRTHPPAVFRQISWGDPPAVVEAETGREVAMTVVRSRAAVLGIAPDHHENLDLHIHMPEGATPKDGPSAGIALCTAIVSVLTGIPARAEVAMTGEITLRGQVLAIGGLKEKLLAAHRGGIKVVLIPDENQRDLKEIRDNIKSDLDIRPVKWIDEVLEIALQRTPEPLEEEPTLETDSAKESDGEHRISAH